MSQVDGGQRLMNGDLDSIRDENLIVGFRAKVDSDCRLTHSESDGEQKCILSGRKVHRADQSDGSATRDLSTSLMMDWYIWDGIRV